MSLPPFFNNATGDPIRSQRRLAPQLVAGVPATTGFIDFLNDGGPVAPQPMNVPRQAIRNTSMRQRSLVGKTDVPNSLMEMGDLDPANKAQIMQLANFLQGYRTVSLDAGARFRHYLSEVELVTTAAAPFLTLLTDPNTGIIARYVDLRTQGFTLTAQARQNLKLGVTVVAGKYDFHGDAVQTSGSGSTPPILRHTSSLSLDADGTDEDIFVKVTTVGTGSLGVKIKVGTASSFTGSEITVPLDTWTWITDQTGAPIGVFSEQEQIYFPPGATAVVNDTFQVPRRRTRWTPSFGIDRPIGEVNIRAYLNGNQIEAEGGWSLTATCPGVARLEGPGGRQGHGTIRMGFTDIKVQATRRIVDLAFQRPLLNRDVVSLVFECKTDYFIPSTSTPYGFTFILPDLRLEGKAYDTEQGGTKQDEVVTFNAAQAPTPFTYNSETFTADLTAIVDTDIATVN